MRNKDIDKIYYLLSSKKSTRNIRKENINIIFDIGNPKAPKF